MDEGRHRAAEEGYFRCVRGLFGGNETTSATKEVLNKLAG